MYSSIDAVSHALNRKLLKYKERRTAGWHGGASMSEDMLKGFSELEQMETEIASEPEELFDDPEKPEVVKIKSFDLDHPISVDEAIFALDYVDHDFYVFKNAETDKVSVVYKRHGGGIGLIEP
jgi:putative sigma-54 modulation protein